MQDYTEQEKYWIWMAFLTEIGPKSFYYIMKEFGDATSFFDAVETGSDALDALPPDIVSDARVACSKQRIAEIIAELATKGITAVTRLSDKYPKLLAAIPYPPPVLFLKGDISCAEQECISIVGTRRCTRKGYELAYGIAEELAEAGVTVVSGMARGIDTAAHTGALDASGRTIAVLGCGTDVIYPPESADIYNSIAQSGAVISELAPGSQPFPGNFPVRNRIIAGLAKGTLIVESETEGGTAITASLAISMGRDVFAVPGPPYLKMAELANMLIKEGARPVCCAKDILDFYGMGGEESGASAGVKQIQLDFLQRQIYNLLLQGDVSVENIASCIKYPQNEINSELTLMELGGLIKRLPGGKYGI